MKGMKVRALIIGGLGYIGSGLIEYYRRQCVLKEIDGDKQIDEIFSELKETLGI